jgi:cytochrome P450
VRDQLVSLYAATLDTVRATSAWVIHELMANAGVWDAAVEEIRSVVAGEPLSAEHLARLGYVDRVINETLRLWPSSAVSARYSIEPVEFQGFTVPARSQVLWSAYVTHRLPEHWPEPERFRPERWKDHEPAPYTFVPFGGGVRQCIGFAFARQQLKVLVTEVLRSMTLEPEYRAAVPAGIPALHPRDGVPVRVHRHRTRRASG